MKRMSIAIAFLLAFGVLFNTAHAEIRGPYGNLEEPALRPYKWMHHGVKTFFFHTIERLKHGNMKTPIIGTVEVGRGLRRGVFGLGEGFYKGMVCAPPPQPYAYRELGELNTAVEEDPALFNISDFSFTWAAFPVMKVCVDNHPLVSEEVVQEHIERAHERDAARREARRERQEAMRAKLEQKRYERVDAGKPLDEKGPAAEMRGEEVIPPEKQLRGNLLRLAR